MKTPDIVVSNHGSIFVVTHRTAAGHHWLQNHIDESAQRWGAGIVVEHRYISDIVIGARQDGLEVE